MMTTEPHGGVVVQIKKLWHTLNVSEVIKNAAIEDISKGLRALDVPIRRQDHGTNEIDKGKGRSLWSIIIPQFANWMSAILLGVFIIAVVTEEWVEAVVVVLIVAVNGIIGSWQEIKSEVSLKAIQSLAVGNAKVLRDGVVRTVPIHEIVFGDVVELHEGDMVPADLRIIEQNRLEIDEASLTGESVPVLKSSVVLQDDDTTLAVGDRTNMAFRQTWVTQGRGRGVAVNIGAKSEIGKLARRLTSSKGVATKTPLMRQVNLLMACLFGVGLVFGIFIFWAFKWNVDSSSLLYASATLVAIIPELAVVLLNVVTALGSSRMASQNAIVRRLTSLERLGKVTDICSDKTGTLTTGKMSAVRVWLASEMGVAHPNGPVAHQGALIANAPPGYSVGSWQRDETKQATESEKTIHEAIPPYSFAQRKDSPSLRIQAEEWAYAMMVCALCSSTYVELNGDGYLRGTGNPTELALQVLAYQAGMSREAFLSDWEPRGEWAFDSTNKRMSAGWRHRDYPVGAVLTKGAPEQVMKLCTNLPEGSESAQRVQSAVDGMAAQGLRVLAVAFRLVHNSVEPHSRDKRRSTSSAIAEGSREALKSIMDHSEDAVLHCADRSEPEQSVREIVDYDAVVGFLERKASMEGENFVDSERHIDLRAHPLSHYARETVEKDLVFVGLIGLRDPPKPESAPAVRECRRAGITVRMLTGDHPETAASIAREIGILRGPVSDGRVMTGPQFDSISPDQLDALEDLPVVVARCSPETKVRMVEALHRRKRIVAMTGDGVNDSPAIKQADVGIAMGITGSEITKSVADLVLADDNFATIVDAIREGRRIFDSIAKFTLHLLSGNVAEGIVLMLSMSFVVDDDDLPVFVLAPLGILWLNTATGTGPAMGLSMDQLPPDIMDRPPLADSLFTRELVVDTMAYGLMMGILTLGGFSYVVWGDGDGTLGSHCNEIGDSSAVGCNTVLRARSTSFAMLTTQLLVHGYNCRHSYLSMFDRSWNRNKILEMSLAIFTILLVPLIYIPEINDKIFKQADISWEWIVVLIGTMVFVALSELYKYGKRKYYKQQLIMEDDPAEETKIELKVVP